MTNLPDWWERGQQVSKIHMMGGVPWGIKMTKKLRGKAEKRIQPPSNKVSEKKNTGEPEVMAL